MRPSANPRLRMLSVRTMTAILRRPAAACAVTLRVPYSTATDEFGPMPKVLSSFPKSCITRHALAPFLPT